MYGYSFKTVSGRKNVEVQEFNSTERNTRVFHVYLINDIRHLMKRITNSFKCLLQHVQHQKLSSAAMRSSRKIPKSLYCGFRSMETVQ